MKKYILVFSLFLCTGFFLFSQTGNIRYVSVQGAVLKSSTGFFAGKVGTLTLGQEVTLVKDDGKWAQVRAGNLTGFVASTSLSTRRVVASSAGASSTEVALAGKGFSQEIEIEYRKNGLDYSLVDSMEKITIPDDELLRFVNEGRLARGE